MDVIILSANNVSASEAACQPNAQLWMALGAMLLSKGGVWGAFDMYVRISNDIKVSSSVILTTIFGFGLLGGALVHALSVGESLGMLWSLNSMFIFGTGTGTGMGNFFLLQGAQYTSGQIANMILAGLMPAVVAANKFLLGKIYSSKQYQGVVIIFAGVFVNVVSPMVLEDQADSGDQQLGLGIACYLTSFFFFATNGTWYAFQTVDVAASIISLGQGLVYMIWMLVLFVAFEVLYGSQISELSIMFGSHTERTMYVVCIIFLGVTEYLLRFAYTQILLLCGNAAAELVNLTIPFGVVLAQLASGLVGVTTPVGPPKYFNKVTFVQLGAWALVMIGGHRFITNPPK